MKVCVVCKTNEGTNGVSFHKFPTDKRLKLWLKNMKLDNWTPKPQDFLCSKHFTITCYKSQHTRTSLKKCSIPTIFFDGAFSTQENVIKPISFASDTERIKRHEGRTFVEQRNLYDSVADGDKFLETIIIVWQIKGNILPRSVIKNHIPCLRQATTKQIDFSTHGDVKPIISISYTKNIGMKRYRASDVGEQDLSNINDDSYSKRKYIKPIISVPDTEKMGINRYQTSLFVKQDALQINAGTSSTHGDVKPIISISYTKNIGMKRNRTSNFGEQDPSNINDDPTSKRESIKPIISVSDTEKMGIKRNQTSTIVKQDAVNINDDPSSKRKFNKPITSVSDTETLGIKRNQATTIVKQDAVNINDDPSSKRKFNKPITSVSDTETMGIKRNQAITFVKQDAVNINDDPSSKRKYIKPITSVSDTETMGIKRNQAITFVKQDAVNINDDPSLKRKFNKPITSVSDTETIRIDRNQASGFVEQDPLYVNVPSTSDADDTSQCRTPKGIPASVIHDHPYDVSLITFTPLDRAHRALKMSLERERCKRLAERAKRPEIRKRRKKQCLNTEKPKFKKYEDIKVYSK